MAPTQARSTVRHPLRDLPPNSSKLWAIACSLPYQSTISPEARVVLDAQAQWLNTNTDYNALIEGHADEQGTREYNLALGARRASAVQDFLVTQGVAPNRLQTVTYGKERPLEICSDEACYSQNRRSVTVLGAGLGS